MPASQDGRAPVDGRLDALHEDVCGQPARLAQPLCSRLAVQVVAAALALRLEHELLWMLLHALQYLPCGRVLQIVQAPQPCNAGTHPGSLSGQSLLACTVQCTQHMLAGQFPACNPAQEQTGEPVSQASMCICLGRSSHGRMPAGEQQKRLGMCGGSAPAKQARMSSASSGPCTKRSTTPGPARSCCTFLAPASW